MTPRCTPPPDPVPDPVLVPPLTVPDPVEIVPLAAPGAVAPRASIAPGTFEEGGVVAGPSTAGAEPATTPLLLRFGADWISSPPSR